MSREFGAKPIRAPTYPIASQYFSVLDSKIINTMVACADEHACLLRPSRAWDGAVEPKSTPEDMHVVLAQVPTPVEIAGILLVAIGVGVHKPIQ